MSRSEPKTYVRDGRSPTPKSGVVSRVMSANKAKDTKPELILRRRLWGMGVRGYRLHYKRVPGRPDICFVGKKLAIFVHGCFWHRCPRCTLRLPKYNTEFWAEKFRRNAKRDTEKLHELQESNWHCLVIWECEIKNGLDEVARKILRQLRG